MTTIILCRHGESEGNAERRFGGHGTTPLTPRGRAQAQAAGRALAAEGVHALYTSDLARALETADQIGAALGCTPVPTAALRERSVGILTGLTFEEAAARHPEHYAALLRRDPDVCPPGGETHAECSQRAVRFLDQVLAEHAGQRVLLVSHNLCMYHLVRHILGLRDNPQAPLCYFQLDNCALSRFARHDQGTWKVIALNERGHLEGI